MKNESNMLYQDAHLVLNDGSVFLGKLVGGEVPSAASQVIAQGEVVFNTSLSGYQEVLSDPSYRGQMVVFTYPHIGNYGVCEADMESGRYQASAVITRDYSPFYSNWRASGSLHGALATHSVPLLTEVDTRRLTRHLRNAGALGAVIGTGDLDELVAMAARVAGTDGVDLVKEVSTDQSYELGVGTKTIAVYDFGVKRSILEQLAKRFRVAVFPATTPAKEILDRGVDGVFLSNGPGDPMAVEYAIGNIRELFSQVPIFGICLGHQLMALAVGGETIKLSFGHHGSNHPVSDLSSSKVEVTAQNHNYAVDPASLGKMLKKAEVSHLNLNDGVIEGLRYPNDSAFSVQYHPEAGPGPHDSYYLFDRFFDLVHGRGLGA